MGDTFAAHPYYIGHYPHFSSFYKNHHEIYINFHKIFLQWYCMTKFVERWRTGENTEKTMQRQYDTPYSAAPSYDT